MTVLFCDLVGFTGRAESMDPEDVRALLSGYHERVRRELERYGGTVEKFVGDAVMALFGAPTAHEDDPERAVRAALAIRAQGRARVRIGITTGEALVALSARPEAGEGMASGDVVNTASRLQAASPENGILVDEANVPGLARRDRLPPERGTGAEREDHSAAVWEAVEARSRVDVDVVERDGERRSSAGSASSTSAARRLLPRAVGARSATRDARRRPRDRQEPTRLRVLPAVDEDSGAHLLAAGPVPALRGRRHVLGCRRDGEVACGHPRDRRRRRAADEARPSGPRWRRRRRALGAAASATAAGARRRSPTRAPTVRPRRSLPGGAFFEGLAEQRRSCSSSRTSIGKALVFYRSVGATRYLREGEALLARTA